MEYLLLIVGITLLVKGAEWFVRGASQLALRLKVTPFVIGLTIVAFGTSAPEAAVSFTASIQSQSDIAYGNVIGSSVANLLLVLGLAAFLSPISIKERIIKKEFPFAIAIVILVLLFAVIGPSYINRLEGLILLMAFGVFLFYILGASRRETLRGSETIKQTLSLKIALTIFFIGLFAIISGGYLVTNNAASIAMNLGMSEVLVGLSIVAIGTSLPELAIIVVAWLKKQQDIALGNIIGSNIFNLSFILGGTALLSPLRLYDFMRIDLLFLLGVTLLSLFFSYTGKILSKKEGFLLILIYGGYLAYIIVRN